MICSALANLATKEIATISGVSFSLVFLALFIGTEKYYERKRRGAKHEHIEQFNRELAKEVTPKNLNLTLPYRVLVAIRSPQNLFMLEKTLADMDPDTTEAVVMTAKVLPPGDQQTTDLHLDAYDEKLMTAVVKKAEGVGKQAIPVIIPTNNPLHAVMRTAYDIGAQEIVIGASNKFTAEEQLDQISLYWVQVNTQESEPRGLTVRTIFLHDGTQASSDLFMSALTLLDPAVVLDIVHVPGLEEEGKDLVEKDVALLERLKRTSRVIDVKENIAEQITKLVRDEKYDLIIMQPDAARLAEETPWVKEIINHAPCQVCLIVSPQIPRDVEE
jgi:nucleotide-binding universal stress UspA family protein